MNDTDTNRQYILIFEDRFTTEQFFSIKSEIENEYPKLRLINYRKWSEFFFDIDYERFTCSDVLGIFLDHLLQDNYEFDREDLAELTDGFSSYSFFKWLELHDCVNKLQFLVGISSTPAKQTTFIPHIDKSTVFNPDKLIEFLHSKGTLV